MIQNVHTNFRRPFANDWPITAAWETVKATKDMTVYTVAQYREGCEKKKWS